MKFGEGLGTVEIRILAEFGVDRSKDPGSKPENVNQFFGFKSL